MTRACTATSTCSTPLAATVPWLHGAHAHTPVWLPPAALHRDSAQCAAAPRRHSPPPEPQRMADDSTASVGRTIRGYRGLWGSLSTSSAPTSASATACSPHQQPTQAAVSTHAHGCADYAMILLSPCVHRCGCPVCIGAVALCALVPAARQHPRCAACPPCMPRRAALWPPAPPQPRPSSPVRRHNTTRGAFDAIAGGVACAARWRTEPSLSPSRATCSRAGIVPS